MNNWVVIPGKLAIQLQPKADPPQAEAPTRNPGKSKLLDTRFRRRTDPSEALWRIRGYDGLGRPRIYFEASIKDGSNPKPKTFSRELMVPNLAELNSAIVKCKKCPRLVRWREAVAKNPPRRYQGQTYWAKPLPGFGDPEARLLIVGLAPAAHGGNRTGRIFTGDRSGDWLYEALYAAGFANQPNTEHRNDGLKLKDCYVTAAVKCAPPENRPTLAEFERCHPYLVRELKLLRNVRFVVALGRIAFGSFMTAFRENGGVIPKPRPQFGHGKSVVLSNGITLMASFHPSQQNTFTGKLTRPMFHAIFNQARAAL